MSKMRVRLAVATLVVVILGISSVALVVESAFSNAYDVLQNALETRASAYSTHLANELSFAVAAGATAEVDSILDAFLDQHPETSGLMVRMADDKVLSQKGKAVPAGLANELKGTKATVASQGDGVVSSAPITAEGKVNGHVLLIEEDLTADQLRSQSRLICFLTYFAVLVFIGLAVFIIGGRLSAPLERMVDTVHGVAEGDLTLPALPSEGLDEAARLGAAFNLLADAQRLQVSSIKEASSKVLENSSQVTSASAQLASAASEQASAIAEATSTVDEIKQAGQMSKESAGQIVENSKRSVDMSGAGLEAVSKSEAEIERIREQVEAISAGIDSLRTRVSEVGEIISLVNQVAEQSNLLAVNASIEAAVAGEYGRGFSVVAQEVKSLAAQSKQATAQVRGTLGKIQEAIGEVVHTAQIGRECAEAGVKSIKSTGEVIRHLSDIISDSSEFAKQIAISANEQVVGLEQIAEAMTSVNQAATENLTSSQQVESASETLNQMARELEQLIAIYKLNDNHRGRP